VNHTLQIVPVIFWALLTISFTLVRDTLQYFIVLFYSCGAKWSFITTMDIFGLVRLMLLPKILLCYEAALLNLSF
jgi:hypothetical protein